MILDVNDSKSLTMSEFRQFMMYLQKHNFLHMRTDEVLARVNAMNKNQDKTLDLYEFVNGIEQISTFLLIQKRPLSASPVRYFFRSWVFETSFYRWVVKAHTFSYIWILMMYNSPILEGVWLYIVISLAALFIVSVCFLVVLYGPGEYWNYAYYNVEKHDAYDVMFMHRGEVFLAFLTVVLFINASIFGTTDFDNSGASSSTMLCFALAVPCLRIFCVLKPVLRILVTLSKVMPSFFSLLCLIMIFMFTFACWGYVSFQDRFSAVLQDHGPDGNFDSISQTLLTLFQLFVGEAWHETMYAAIECSDWSAAWYFIAYNMILTMLLGNLMFGVILEAFQKVGFDEASLMAGSNDIDELLAAGDEAPKSAEEKTGDKKLTPLHRFKSRVSSSPGNVK
jgi:hypothetical protein